MLNIIDFLPSGRRRVKMRILLAEDERSLSRAVIALLEKTITPPMRFMMARRPWSTWRQETTTPSSWI
jgi:hypothetical protein